MSTYLTQPLHRMKRQAPDDVAAICRNRSVTWRDLHGRVARLATVLRSQGVEDGQHVAILAQNSEDYLVMILAVLWAGGVFMPINTRWNVHEIVFALQDSGARFLFVDEAFAGMLPAIQAGGDGATLFGLGDMAAPGICNLEAMIASAEAMEDRLRSDDDMACLLYTGGTTGRSKGVMLSHRNITTSAASYAGFKGATPGTAMLQIAPLFHVAGINALWGALLAGSCNIFLTGFDPLTVLATIEREAVTDIFMVPTMLQAVLDHPRFAEFDLRVLERIVYGASPIAEALLDKALALLPGVAFIQAYGMTELSPVATILGPDDHVGEGRAKGRLRSAGRATMMTEVRIVDPDDHELPHGTVGEIVARGGNMMLGYWNLPDETREAMRGGWMHTGDLGFMDDDGYLYVVDRLKDMIVSGGENVYSAEVENILSTHTDVAQCAVIGIPHPIWGESVHAVVVPAPGKAPSLEELRHHCKAAMAGYKCPRSLELREALPLSAAGKVLKAQLRAAIDPLQFADTGVPQ